MLSANLDRKSGRGASFGVMTAVATIGAYDGELGVMQAVQRGDRRAFEDFLRGQDRWVRGVILGVLGDPGKVDDVAQQVWLTVWQRAGELREVQRWRPWLYRLAYNAAIDAGREVSRRKAHSLTVGDASLRAVTNGPEADAEERRVVLDAVLSLPAIYREPFVLRHVNGWSYQQIAEVMDMPVVSVETRLVRARRMLRDVLRDKVR